MIVSKSLVGKCLQCLKKLTNESNKNANAVFRTNSHCKEEVLDHMQQKSQWLYTWFYSCPIALWTFSQLRNASSMEVNTYRKTIFLLFIFMDLEWALFNKLRRKLKRNCKTLSNVKSMQILYCLLMGVYQEVSSRG